MIFSHFILFSKVKLLVFISNYEIVLEWGFSIMKNILAR